MFHLQELRPILLAVLAEAAKSQTVIFLCQYEILQTTSLHLLTAQKSLLSSRYQKNLFGNNLKQISFKIVMHILIAVYYIGCFPKRYGSFVLFTFSRPAVLRFILL